VVQWIASTSGTPGSLPPFALDGTDIPMTKITLCTIVKNEESTLPACLESVADCVDAMIVVDTGSTDRTVAVAKNAGATVVNHKWNDDFAAARNAAIEHVTEGYVLVLDADEQLGPNAASAIRNAVASGEIDGARLPLYNAKTSDATHEQVLTGAQCIGPATLLERLLRVTPDLRWRGIIHEHLTDWYLKGRTIVTIDAPIIHYGSVPEFRASRAKSKRNLTLLERICKEDKSNPLYLTYLSQELLTDGQFDRASKYIDMAWSLIEKLPQNTHNYPIAIPAATVRVAFLIGEKKFSEAKQVIETTTALSNPHPNVHLLTATLLQALWTELPINTKNDHLLDIALQECENCYRFHGVPLTSPGIPGATDWAAKTRQGNLNLLLQNYPQACVCFDAALKSCPGNIEAILGRAEAFIHTERAQQALSELMPLLHPNIADSWVLAAWAGYQFGSYSDVAPMVQEARVVYEKQGIMGPHRVSILESLEAIGVQQLAA